jgi:thiol-disulfide isomerase/thioredoxin
MSRELTYRRPLVFALALGVCATALLPIVAEDAKEKPKDAAATDAKDADAKEADTKETPKADPYEIPKDADTKKLAKFIASAMRVRPQGESREEMVKDYLRGQRAISEAASRILADKDATDEAAMAMQVKIRALQSLEQLGDEDTSAEKKKLVKLYKDDKREGVGEMIAYLDLSSKLDEAFAGDDMKKAAATIIKAIDEDDGKSPMISQMFRKYAQTLERQEAYPEAATVYSKLKDAWSKSDNPQLKAMAARFDGVVRRLGSFGKAIDLEGQYLDGSEVDWKKYRGKFVLVDYWATWCGPCIQELPNVLDNYEKYHEKGFDVLGISLDGSRAPGPEAIEANKKKVAAFLKSRSLPWKTLYSDDPDATGWKHPMATRFGISGIPFAMLVDREGKIISFNARGPRLGELLKENLGPVESADDAKPADDARPAG